MSQLFLFGKVAGIVMFIFGFVLNYKVNRRRFNRKRLTGIQVFDSYEDSWMTRWKERIFKWIAIILIIAGIMIFLGSIMVPPRIK